MIDIPEDPEIAERLAMYDSWDAVAPLPNRWEPKAPPDVFVDCSHPGGAKYMLFCKRHDLQAPTYLCDNCITRTRLTDPCGCNIDELHRVIIK